MNDALPEQISKYKISRILGKGSMGVVYEGFDPDIQRKVAIKTLTPNIADQSLIDEYHSRFKIEAQASARCMHPNIVTILEYGDLDGMPFMVMEFIQGNPLDEILKLNAPIKFNRALKMFSQMIKGLHYAHQNGVVHRDIKPSNIMVTDTDAVKITDFGIARLPVSSEVTQLGYTVGTPHYMAPEQEATSSVDGRADLFSLSVILMEILAKVPVTSAVEHSCLSPQGIYITPRVNMTQMIPMPFLPVLQKGLAFKPEERFANAQDYARAVKQAVEEIKQERAPTGMPPVVQPPVSDGSWREQLDEMESMLVNYVGPIGASLIEHYAEETHGLYELAQKVAEEIASPQDREAFLKAWEATEEVTEIPRVNTDRVHTRIKPAASEDETVLMQPSVPRQQEKFQLEGSALNEVELLYAEYVGPMAEMMLQDIISESSDYDDFVMRLAEAIPTEVERTDFRLKIKKIAN